ncbi:glycoside hydrolase family 130 protein [Portibacter marinus]|uniref:glycoside hydrolase family 130 protein n=1 Tax=Portibacter marinus TaxID=2898660 RepID=UPI001F2D87B8|nr:glycoside hydrolase family 130 protein [Portibacter marinus]
MEKRFTANPIITKADLEPSRSDWQIDCVMNPGAFTFDGKIWLLLRVAERPIQKKGKISLPIYTVDGDVHIIEFDENDSSWDTSDPRKFLHDGSTYLSTISHLRLVCSEDGIHFDKPDDIPDILSSQGIYETYGIEDCRVSQIENQYYLTYTQVSELGVGVGMRTTKDWINFVKTDMIFLPHNKDCALFEETINGQYFALNRPSGVGLGGNFIWLSSSPDLYHWGNHHCLMMTREGMWDSERVGAGTSPIKTEDGWLMIYHGADQDSRYCLGAALLDLNNPTKVIARSVKPLMEPEAPYEKEGFFKKVIFTNGHIVQGDRVTVYYGAADEVICGATFSIEEILESILTESLAE